jgi:hypothetical protein
MSQNSHHCEYKNNIEIPSESRAKVNEKLWNHWVEMLKCQRYNHIYNEYGGNWVNEEDPIPIGEKLILDPHDPYDYESEMRSLKKEMSEIIDENTDLTVRCKIAHSKNQENEKIIKDQKKTIEALTKEIEQLKKTGIFPVITNNKPKSRFEIIDIK